MASGPNDPIADLEALHEAMAVYTADGTVADLLRRIGWPRKGRLLDPACGDGAFLTAALAAMAPVPGANPSARLRGLDIHPGAVAAARMRLVAALCRLDWSAGAAVRQAERIVGQADFLLEGADWPEENTDAPDRGRLLIVGNPPYMRYARLPGTYKQLYAHLPAHEKADLQNAFLAASARLADKGACTIAMVTSDRWLINDRAAALREAIGRRFHISDCTRLEAASAYRVAKARHRGSGPRVHPVRVILDTEAGERTLGRQAFAIGARRSVEETPHGRLTDYATVRVGPYLGPKGVFSFDGETARTLTATIAIGDSGTRIVPAATTRDILPDDTLSPPTTFALITRADIEPGPAIRRHVETELARCGRQPRRTWWLPKERAGLDISRPAVVVPRIAKRIRAIPIAPDRLPLDHHLYIVTSGILDVDGIVAILQGPLAQEHLERHAPRLEDGFYDIRSSLIRSIPVAPP